MNGFTDYTIDTKGNVFSKRKNKYLKQAIDRYGYCKVTLQKNKTKKMYSVHRLVAQAFIENPNEYPCVNHIDSDRENNNVQNLEWCTHKQNTEHAVKNHRFDNIAKQNSIKMKENKVFLKNNGYLKANEAVRKKVLQYDKCGNFISKYNSITDASKETGISITNISYCVNKKRKSAGGYVWCFA